MKNRKLLIVAAVAALAVFGTVAYATADVASYAGAGSPLSASGTVNVKATVNPKLTLTITTPDAPQAVDFGSVDPGSAIGGKQVSLAVQSNKVYSVSKTVSGQNAEIGLATTLADSTGNAKTGGATFTDDYSINVPFTTDPGAYTATVQYTVAQ